MTFKNLGWDGVQCLSLHASAARCKIMYFIGYENVSFVQIEDVNFNGDVLVLEDMSLLPVIFHGE